MALLNKPPLDDDARDGSTGHAVVDLDNLPILAMLVRAHGIAHQNPHINFKQSITAAIILHYHPLPMRKNDLEAAVERVQTGADNLARVLLEEDSAEPAAGAA